MLYDSEIHTCAKMENNVTVKKKKKNKKPRPIAGKKNVEKAATVPCFESVGSWKFFGKKRTDGGEIMKELSSLGHLSFSLRI